MASDKKQNFHWPGKSRFILAQGQVLIILFFAKVINDWPDNYPRNENHNPTMFWLMNGALFVAAMITMKHKESTRGVVLLGRAQTEEWKGWMQWAFIMYHYYRAYFVYNEIRVFVSAYVWMTGFGNFLYFDKKKDFTINRMISMWLRINYFPLLLSFSLGVPIELYYVVPLHTIGFFVTMATCYIAYRLENRCKMGYWSSRWVAIAISFAVHVIFYETSMVDLLKYAGNEIHLRFQIDKYSALVGIVCGLLWGKFGQYMNWAHGEVDGNSEGYMAKVVSRWVQRFTGVALIAIWYNTFGYMSDKYIYNPIHPYIFFLPVFGWLMIRNSSRFLTEVHSTALEWMGRITLETYVLQFHVFMCKDVQYIPIIIPGSGPNGSMKVKALNMLFCGVFFVALAYWARKVTVATQETVTELVDIITKKPADDHKETQMQRLVLQNDKDGAFLEKEVVDDDEGDSDLEVITKADVEMGSNSGKY